MPDKFEQFGDLKTHDLQIIQSAETVAEYRPANKNQVFGTGDQIASEKTQSGLD
jgi:hypothetical protein